MNVTGLHWWYFLAVSYFLNQWTKTSVSYLWGHQSKILIHMLMIWLKSLKFMEIFLTADCNCLVSIFSSLHVSQCSNEIGCLIFLCNKIIYIQLELVYTSGDVLGPLVPHSTYFGHLYFSPIAVCSPYILQSFLAATKQLYKWYFPSVCPSVRLSVCLSVRLSVCHTFLTMFPSSYHHEIFRSYYQWPK